jgi:hypothetical protein
MGPLIVTRMRWGIRAGGALAVFLCRCASVAASYGLGSSDTAAFSMRLIAAGLCALVVLELLGAPSEYDALWHPEEKAKRRGK